MYIFTYGYKYSGSTKYIYRTKFLLGKMAGVPQGSLLAPSLFLIFMVDLPKSRGVEHAIYADDTAIFTTSRDENHLRRRLQHPLDEIPNWAARIASL